MKAWTDYPIFELGDLPNKPAPVRACVVTDYDGNKYCEIEVGGVTDSVKAGYIYQREGRLGEVPAITRRQLWMIRLTQTK